MKKGYKELQTVFFDKYSPYIVNNGKTVVYSVNMIKNAVILCLLFFLSAIISALPQKEEMYSKTMTISEHRKLFEKWEHISKGSYTMEVSYNAFSPYKGIWRIKVENFRVIQWTFKNRTNDEKDRSAAFMLIQKNLFKIAEDAYVNTDNSPYITSVVYSKKGYIKAVTKNKNPRFTGRAPSDRGFAVKILEISY